MTGQTADLLRHGFRIFPIAAGKKFLPLVEDWPARATNNPAAVASWEKQFPGCTWGVQTEGMVVLAADVDDEIIADGLYTEEDRARIQAVLETSPEWAKYFPIAAGCWINERYKK